jgi:hypothetical protein
MSPNTNRLNVPSTRPSPCAPKEDVSKANAEERGAAGTSDPNEPDNKGPCVQAILQALNTHT